MKPKVEKRALLREGKAKILYETDRPQEFLIQYFKNDATAFNAQKKGTIEGKGRINNQVTSWLYPWLEKNGIPTHFVERLSDREMLVRRVEIIPVEVVVRNRAAGSITKRLGIAKGETFETPLVEYFYKSDELGDPMIGETHIEHFRWATKEEMTEIRTKSLKVNGLLKSLFAKIGLDLVDFKLEFGRDAATGRVILADEFSPDGSRLWDIATGEPMDKDRFRQDLGRIEEAYGEVYNRLKKHFEGET